MNAYAIPKELQKLQMVYCDKRALDNLDQISGVKWHADLLDDTGDPCGRMLLGVDSALGSHPSFRWSCQINCHFASEKYHDGPIGCGIGSSPQQAYDAACSFFERFGKPELAVLFRRFNHD